MNRSIRALVSLLLGASAALVVTACTPSEEPAPPVSAPSVSAPLPAPVPEVANVVEPAPVPDPDTEAESSPVEETEVESAAEESAAEESAVEPPSWTAETAREADRRLNELSEAGPDSELMACLMSGKLYEDC